MLVFNITAVILLLSIILNCSASNSSSFWSYKQKDLKKSKEDKNKFQLLPNNRDAGGIVFERNITKANLEMTNPTSEDIIHNNSGISHTKVRLSMKQGLIMNQILNVYALTDVQDNSLCQNHSRQFSQALRAFEPWALKMFDASSKLQSGILLGNLVEFGSFTQCLQIYHPSKVPIRGKHCTLKVYPDLKLLKRILSFRNITEKRFSKVEIFVKNASLDWSVCVPDSCDTENILSHYKKMITSLGEGLHLNVSLTDKDCATVFDDKPLNRTELGIIISLSIYLMVVMIFTIMEIYSTPEEVQANNLVNIFSAYSNSRHIFAKVKTPSDLDCVHGIRFLSTCYVVIGHRYLMMMFFPVINSLEIMEWVLYYRSTAITGGTLCVDSFFMVSGMLVSIGYFDQLAKSRRINWPIFYIYRYLRITPPLALVVLLYATLIQHFGSGPLWNEVLSIVQKPCQDYWWATILHVQNYVNPFPLCLTQAWYLTCDMQYYFLSPIILIPFGRSVVFGCGNFIVIYGLSIFVNFYLAWVNEYDGGVPITNQLFSTAYFQYHYITPHTRAATYIIGLGFGYAVYRHKNQKLKIRYSFAVLLWIFFLIIMMACLMGCHIFHTEEHKFNKLEASIFLSCSRSGWTFGIVWIVWACINGYGGPINSILSSHVFRILGRISYGIYLLHMLMQYLTSGASKMPGYFSDFTALYTSFSDLFLMVIIGFIFTVCFESPLIKSLSLLIRKGEKKKVDAVKE